MINDDELQATLADRERHAPDIDAVRREITGRKSVLGRWSGRGPVLLAAAGVAALAVLTAVVVIGARDRGPAAAPPAPAPISIVPSLSVDQPPSDEPDVFATGSVVSQVPSVSPRAGASRSTTAPTVEAVVSVSVSTAYPGEPAAPVAATTRMIFKGGSIFVAWNLTGDRLLITTMGNSCNPERIDRVTLTASQQITLEIPEDDSGRICPAYAAPFTYELIIPTDISSSAPLTLVVNGEHKDVPPFPRAPTGPATRAFRSDEVFNRGVPAPVTHDGSYRTFLAQWARDGRLFITTAGSSSIGCERSIISVTLTGPQSISIGTGHAISGTPIPTTVIQTCHEDLAPLTSEIVLPDGIVSTEPLTIVLDGVALELPPAP